MSISCAVEVALERVQVLGPEPPIRLEPRLELIEGLLLELVDAQLRRAAPRYEARFAQDLELLRDRRLARARGRDELVHAHRRALKRGQEPPPILIRQRDEHVHAAYMPL